MCYRAWMLVVVLFAADGFAEPKHLLFQTQDTYLLINILSDDVIHFEASSSAPPQSADRISRSPMLASFASPGPSSLSTQDHRIKTANLDLVIDNQTLCVHVTDRKRGYDLPSICPQDLQQNWKRLDIAAPHYTHLYGLGQHFLDEHPKHLNLAGRVLEPGAFGNVMRPFSGGATGFTQIPILYALGQGQMNAAIFNDNVYKQRWDFSRHPWRVQSWGDHLRWFLIAGDDLATLRRTYMELTGKSKLLSRDKFGLWVSEFGFESWEELQSHLASLRSAQMPVDGFALDLQWYGGKFGLPDTSRMGSLDWDRSQFPSPEVIVPRLKNSGIELMLIEQPYIASHLTEYSEMSSNQFLVRDCMSCGPTFLDENPWWGRGGMIDFSNPSANRYWHREKRSQLIDIGITNHWTDLGEPEMYHDWAYYHGYDDLHQHGDIHNLYNFFWAQGIVEGYKNDERNLRPFILARSGTAGSQRHWSAIWSGDIGANTASMRAHYAAQAHMSLSGIDYYGSDLGGFYRGALGADEENELFTRWLANGLAIEFPARTHVANLDNQRTSNPARIGDTPSNQANISARYELIPYLYSEARNAAMTGDPLVAPLLYYDQTDPQARDLTDHKMIGRDLLVALAIEPNERARWVYLPAGNWYDYHSNEVFISKGRWLEDVPLMRDNNLRLPMYARAGVIIPTTPNSRSVLNSYGLKKDGTSERALDLRVFLSLIPGVETYDFYEDDGRSLAFETGAFDLTRISQHREESSATIALQPLRRSWEETPLSRDLTITLHPPHRHPPMTFSIDGQDLRSCNNKSDKKNCWNSAGGLTKIRLSNTNWQQPLSLKANW